MNIPATTIQEQLSILKNRNVRLDENSAGILLQYGYYNLIIRRYFNIVIAVAKYSLIKQ